MENLLGCKNSLVDFYELSNKSIRARDIAKETYGTTIILNDNAIRKIFLYSPIIEVEAGNGYWAHILQGHGVDIVPFDLNPPLRKSRAFTEIFFGGKDAIERYSDYSLMFCQTEEYIARDFLKSYKGKTVIQAGENRLLILAKALWSYGFEMRESIYLPSWEAYNDRLLIWKRNLGPEEASEAHRREG